MLASVDAFSYTAVNKFCLDLVQKVQLLVNDAACSSRWPSRLSTLTSLHLPMKIHWEREVFIHVSTSAWVAQEALFPDRRKLFLYSLHFLSKKEALEWKTHCADKQKSPWVHEALPFSYLFEVYGEYFQSFDDAITFCQALAAPDGPRATFEFSSGHKTHLGITFSLAVHYFTPCSFAA